MSLYLGDQIISGQATLVGESRNIGQIIPSAIPLTDAGLHLLDGSLINGSGIYSAFVTYIAGLVSTYPNLFVTESAWQTAVTTYGVCGKFVYDATANTVRLPKVTGKVDGTTDINSLGDLAPLIVKLPNITGNTGRVGNTQGINISSNNNGAIYSTVSGTGAYSGGGGRSNEEGVIYFDASRSSSVYSGNGTDTTIHEQAINVLLYVVIATSTKTDIQVDIDEIAADLNGKVNISDLAEVQCVIETYSNGTSWYRVYSDGWCEQGGQANVNNTTITVTFLKPYIDTNYYCNCRAITTGSYASTSSIENRTTISMGIRSTANATWCWQASGYII